MTLHLVTVSQDLSWNFFACWVEKIGRDCFERTGKTSSKVSFVLFERK